MADRHFRVDKQVVDQPPSAIASDALPDTEVPELRTIVRVNLLEEHSHRRDEIAQLAGGQSAQEAMTFAESLLTKAARQRQTQTDPLATVPAPKPSRSKRKG
jgi:DNA repair protein RecN (Recombination protein N)